MDNYFRLRGRHDEPATCQERLDNLQARHDALIAEEQALLAQEEADTPPTPELVAEWAQTSTSPSTAARLDRERR